MSAELYGLTGAGWTSHLLVECLMCVIIICGKNFYNTLYVTDIGMRRG
jgi:hypothetical protein